MHETSNPVFLGKIRKLLSICCLLNLPLFASIDMSKSMDGRVYFRNSGVKGLIDS